MMVRISILALAFGLGSLTDPSSSSSLLVSAQHLSSEETNAPQRRRRLKPNDNVGEKIKEEHAKGSKSAKFTIATKIDVGSDGAGSELDLDVMELESAVTDDTIIEIRDEADGTERSISSVSERFGEDSLATILATDPSSADGQDGTFALLAVDLKNDEMHGFVDKKGKSKPFNIKQEKGSKGGKSMAEEETDEAALVAPDWSCGVQDEFEDSEAERRLDEHNHSHHDHHHHDHDHQDDEDTAGIMESLSRQLRGANIKPIGKRVPGNRDLQTVYESTGIYDYQVDIYMEIDNSFITKTGGTLAKATNYINLLVSAANVIYEKEIHTHLHVSHIVVSTLYDSATGTSNALDKMRAAYASGTWHTPNIDLHHALLGNPLGGGIAYVGVLCDSSYGFGLTASISGNFVSLSNAVMWDLKAFAHEVGHNFGSGHTHEAYSPVIDACGTTCPGGTGSKWSTLMSYCHLCSGSYNNIMYTFGGLYDGSGTKSDINNWFDKPELMANASPGRTSVDPRRESHRMYNHARTRSNNCLARADPTPQPTPQPTFSPKPTVFQVPVIDATYDSTLKVPKCSLVGGGCDSKSLLVGRSSKGPEPNQPNTIASSCADGTAGGFHSDESNDSIKVVSVGGGALTEGTEVKIEATVWAWSASYDHVDFWYTSNVNGAATSWTLINTVSPTTSGALNTVSATYTLPTGGLQAVRVVMRYQGSAATACPGGTYDDADDLVFAVGSDNSNPSPPTSNPTPGPTPSPTSSPTNPPTPPPTNAPINPPTNQPTPLPTNAPINPPTNQPTPLPTSSPTNLPTVAVTTATPTPPPTRSPTNAPTPPPVTTTTPPPTSSPTNAPTPPPTSSPTNIPTAIPTSNPGSTGGGPQIAVFDGVFPAPRCANVGNLCDSQELLTGRSTKGPELNHPNTFGSCPDGTSGSFHSDESLDKIVVRSGGLDGTGSEVDFVEGGLVTIIASVWAWGSGGSDRADFYYASDASNPNWVLIGTEIPTAGGAQVLKRSYTLPAGGTQAVRVNFRYSGTQSPCSNGAYDDRDDLVFAVGSAGPPAPTGEPTSYPTWSPTDGPTPSPTIFSSGPQLATFDSLLGAPKCSFGSQCDSADLLIGRGTMSGGNEINRPNTLDNCADGNSGSFHGDESLDKIVVRSGEVDGTGSGVDLTEGGRATIIASVWAWSTGTSDRADFYYASEASSTPTWVYIGTEIPPAGGAQDLKRAYTIPSGGIQAVRVNFRYGGSVASSCNSGSYNDRDDLVFAVISNPSFSGDVIMGSDLPNPNGNVIVDAGRPTEDGRGDVIAEDVSPAEIEPKPEDPDGEEKKGKKEKGKKGKKD